MYTNPKLGRATGKSEDNLIKPAPTHKREDKDEKANKPKPDMNSELSKMTHGGIVSKRV